MSICIISNCSSSRWSDTCYVIGCIIRSNFIIRIVWFCFSSSCIIDCSVRFVTVCKRKFINCSWNAKFTVLICYSCWKNISNSSYLSIRSFSYTLNFFWKFWSFVINIFTIKSFFSESKINGNLTS